MKSCDDYQLALEMRRHGALDPAEAREVEAHLSTCSECMRAEERAEALNGMLRNAPGPRPSQQDDIMERARQEARRTASLPAIMLLSFVLQGPLLSWLIAPGSMLKVWGIFWVAGVLAAVGSALWLRSHSRRARAALSQGVEAWISERRRTLLSSRAQLKFVRPAGPLLALVTGAAAVHATVQDLPHVALLWTATAIFFAGAVVMLRYGRTIERELRSLGEVGP